MREADSCGSTTIREDDLFAQEEKTHTPGSWDQFEGNQHLISATSTYEGRTSVCYRTANSLLILLYKV